MTVGYIEAGLVSEESVAERKHIYRLLARIWIHEVDRNLILELSQTPLKESFVTAGVTFLPFNALLAMPVSFTVLALTGIVILSIYRYQCRQAEQSA